MLTDEQIEMRRGKICASSIHNLCKPKGLGKTGESYIWQVIAEIETGETHEVYENTAMQWGNEHEAEAAQYFQHATRKEVKQGESIISGIVCVTPDYYIVGEETGIEIKCPYNSANHAQRIRWEGWEDLKVNYPECYWQIAAGMLVTGFEKWKFLSYDPRFKSPEKRMVSINVPRVEKDITLLENRISEAVNIMIQAGIDVNHDHADFYKAINNQQNKGE
jgi:hypothetical protein